MSADATHTSPPDPTRTAGDGTRTANPPVLDTPTADGDPAPPAPLPDAPPGFVLDREIGRGGMGVVYLARQVGLNRPVALKLIQSGDTGSVLRFLAEAEAMAAVRHPNVAEVYQFGEHAGRPFLALEYCPGGDLTKLVNRDTQGSAPVSREAKASAPHDTAKLFLAIAEGVAAAHAAGIVHRDLKPHNVLLTANGTPKVTDFGLAKREGGSDLTRTTAVMGTPAYMPPEQAKGETKFVGPQADVWALGVMLYEALTGTRPFAGADHWAVLAAVQRGTFPPPRAVVNGLPRDLELVCLKCLKADPQDRYPTAAELASDLRNWLDGKPISARPAGLIEQAAKWAKRNKRLAVMGLAVLLTMAAATGVSLGFGLDANEQRRAALKEKQNALDATEQAEQEVSRTQRTLAKALLAPIWHTRQDDDMLNVYESRAIWELVSVRDGPVPLLLLEEATSSELAAAQFSGRAKYLDHAAVGLDSRRRRLADDLLDRRLKDPTLSADLKRELALAAISSDRFSSVEAVAEALTTALTNVTDERERSRLATALAVAAPLLPAEQGVGLCGGVAERLMAALAEHPPEYDRRELAVALAAVAQRLPAEKGAEVLIASLERATTGDERRALADGLATLAGRLPADQAARVCGRAANVLAAAIGEEWYGHTLRVLACGLAAVAAHLPADEATEVCGLAAKKLDAALAKESTLNFYLPDLAIGLATMAERLPTVQGAEVCRRAAAVLVVEWEKQTTESSREQLAVALAAVAQRLPAEKGAEVLIASLERATTGDERRALADGLATLAGRLPADQAARVCGRAANVLAAALTVAKEWRDRWAAAWGLSAVAQRLKADRGAEVLAAALSAAKGYEERGALAAGLAAVSERLPTDTRATLCRHAAEGLVARLAESPGGEDFLRLAEGLGAVASGLTGRSRIYRRHSVELAALAGVVAVHPAVLPTPRPLPPQQLVELLKHPFCVKEARRAVLDALEFTYDRKFADLWAFVEFAEKEHPELDLLTPPKRPERK